MITYNQPQPGDLIEKEVPDLLDGFNAPNRKSKMRAYHSFNDPRIKKVWDETEDGERETYIKVPEEIWEDIMVLIQEHTIKPPTKGSVKRKIDNERFKEFKFI